MKKEIRSSILEKRVSLSREEIQKMSIEIKDKLFSLDEFKSRKNVMFYVSFKSEVDTHLMAREALRDKNVSIPKLVGKNIEPSLINDFDNLLESRNFGMLEPIELIKVNYKNIDLIIVPGVVFDLRGHRIGSGLGYYDKFLKKIPKAFKIGLAFDFQVVENIPNEVHDIPVDMIVTEKRIIVSNK